MNRRAPLCVWLFAATGLVMAGQQDVKYIPLEGRLELHFDWTPTTVTLFKTVPKVEQPAVVAEWHLASPAKDIVYGTYEGRTELDKGTGVVIKNVTKEDSGTYFMVFNGKRQSESYKFEVINSVPKPSVDIKPPCSPKSTICSLVCEGNITDSGPVTIRWKKDEGEWMESGQNWTITNDEKWKKVEKVFCEIKNPLSVEQSDPCDNPLYIKDNDTPVAGIIGGIIVALILAVGLVLGVKYRDRTKRERMLTSCEMNQMMPIDGSVPLLPVVIIPVSPVVKELIQPILDKATSLYVLCEEVKGSKKQCQRLVQRVKGLEELVLTIMKEGAGQNSDGVEEALRDLNETLDSAKYVVKKYIYDSFHKHVFKDYNDSEFRSLNGRLNTTFNKLSENVQVDHDHQLYKMFNEASQQAEDEADRKEDHEELKRIMDLIDLILDRKTSLYPLCVYNPRYYERRLRLVKRLEVLDERLDAIKQKGPGQNSADVEEALCELKTTLESDEVAKFVKTYNPDNVLDYGNEFDNLKLNKRLGSALNKLSSALPDYQNHKLFEEDR